MLPHDLEGKRRAIAPLLASHDPADALASYYALWHDPRRTQLYVHEAGTGVDGFIAVCQTGADLFRPLVTLRATASREATASELLRTALVPQRPYRVVVPVGLATAVRSVLEVSNATLNQILLLDPSRFQPIINVLVQPAVGADGTLRFQIESQGEPVAISGTNWRSPTFAEVFAYVHPRARGRGWGRSVVSAMTASLLVERVRPLYLAEESNEASLELARSLGYTDTGGREMSCDARLTAKGNPAGA